MTNILSKLYRENLALLTDLYQLTMANGYWKKGLYNRQAVFHLFFRKNPFGGDYTVTSGLQTAIDWLENFQFSLSDIQYLGAIKGADGQPLFQEGFLNHLQRMKFQCEIDAMPEGTVAFPNQPIIRVKGPLIQAQLIETTLLNIINFQTLIATKAARIKQAADGDMVMDFGLRRAQGMDGGLSASRAAYVGGCDATSNVLAGKLWGIPVKGTHAHSWVMCFEEEIESFATYAEAMPNNCIFLVDTYDTLEGVQNAIKIGQQLRTTGHDLLGIRLDSGDLATLSIEARKLLDAAGFQDTKIVASNDLDENRIKELKEKGAKISVWGVGTRLVTAYDQPALGGVYKLAAIQDENGVWKDRVKLSEQAIKVSNPGIQQVKRIFENGQPVADAIYEEKITRQEEIEIIDKQGISLHYDLKEYSNLLVPIFRNGTKVYNSLKLSEIRTYSLKQQLLFSKIDKNYTHGLEKHLQDRKEKLIKNHRKNTTVN